MNLVDRLAATHNPGQGLPCPLRKILGSLTDEERDALQGALDVPVGSDGRLSSRTLARVLHEEGHTINVKAVENHRRRVCRCFTGVPK